MLDHKCPGITGLFLSDSAPSHTNYLPDGLAAVTMNVYPGGKQPLMKDTVWNGSTQRMVLPAKGTKLVIQECERLM